MRSRRILLLVPSGPMEPGDKMGTHTSNRVQSAYTFFKSLSTTDDVYFLFSGSRLRPLREQSKTDAEIMADELLSRGIKQSRIFIEDRALDTFENVRFSDQLIRERDLHPDLVYVVSEKNHLRRFRWAFKKLRPSYVVRYLPAQYKLNFLAVMAEWGIFLLLHVPDPLGNWHPWAKSNRAKRFAKSQA